MTHRKYLGAIMVPSSTTTVTMESQVVGRSTAPASQLPPQSSLPVVLGKYQLVRFLGRGNFAKVYQARSLSDNATVAIKIIEKSRIADASMEPRIIREVDAMRRLHHHPNILRIFEVLATKTKIYLVVELASGGELFSKVSRRRRLSEPEARFYVQQLVSALKFCHENGICHRDVKPQNLLLDREGQLKVSDFGLAALPEQINNNGLLHTACGTPAYAAPEIFSRRAYDGSKADAWSCGVILFVLLSGNLPFDDGNLVTMYKKINRREYVFPEWISKPARYIIYQLLDPNPNRRMSIEVLAQTKWFKKSLVQRSLVTALEMELYAKNRKSELSSTRSNAFDIITMSSGLDLSGLFETTGMSINRLEKRFTSKVPMKDVMEKMGVVAGELGYRIERCRDSKVLGLGKGNVAVMVEALEIVSELLLVALRVVDGASEFEELHWSEMRAGLQDVVLSWQSV